MYARDFLRTLVLCAFLPLVLTRQSSSPASVFHPSTAAPPYLTSTVRTQRRALCSLAPRVATRATVASRAPRTRRATTVATRARPPACLMCISRRSPMRSRWPWRCRSCCSRRRCRRPWEPAAGLFPLRLMADTARVVAAVEVAAVVEAKPSSSSIATTDPAATSLTHSTNPTADRAAAGATGRLRSQVGCYLTPRVASRRWAMRRPMCS